MRHLLFCCCLFHLTAAHSQSAFDQAPTVLAAKTLLANLNTVQKAKVNLPLSDSSRAQWSNLPMLSYNRQGLWLNDLSDEQKMAVHALLRSVLSVEGYQKVLFIIQYDEDIKQRQMAAQNPVAERYGQEKYWITIFGNPDINGIWAWKFEGHHLSLNFTHSPKGITCTPMFVGINPALTSSGPFAGRYLLTEESEAGKQLFASLSPEMKQKTILGAHPTDADPMARTGKESFLKTASGIAFKDLNKEQQALVLRIIRAWAGNLAAPLAKEKTAAILKNKKALRFVWYGTTDAEALHYYRLFTPDFIIEMTNRDGGLQHFHSLWRLPKEDFGGGGWLK